MDSYHYQQVISALKIIREQFTLPNLTMLAGKMVDLPYPHHPSSKFNPINQCIENKVMIFDMDETLIHCVEDHERDNPDVVIPI